MKLNTLAQVNCKGLRVMIREDLNVPLDEQGRITNDQRIQAAIPALKYALEQGAAVIVISHLGRPQEGQPEAQYSLQPVQQRLQELLHHPVRFESHWIDGLQVTPGEVVLCENVRFLKGEGKNDATLAQQMASLCDVFVMDAFATAHRAQASTYGVAQFAPVACAGPLLMKEVEALGKTLAHPLHPLMAIVGGAKVSSKLDLIEHLIQKADTLILGGGIANTFLAAKGYAVGASLYEPDLVENAKRYLQMATDADCEILLPQDVVVAEKLAAGVNTSVKPVSQVLSNEMILDVGPETTQAYQAAIMRMATILWNGPVGVFENPLFADGTRKIAESIAATSAFTLAGGGDTVAAIDLFGIGDAISYVSTGGGAFLEFAEGKQLPALEILEARAN